MFLRVHHHAWRVSKLDFSLYVAEWEALGYEEVGRYETPTDRGTAYSIHLEHSIDLSHDVFISHGTPGSEVARWVKKYGNQLHHIAHEVEEIYSSVEHLRCQGYQFLTDDVVVCPCKNPLKQIFTTARLNGPIRELIQVGQHNGFCFHNVRRLMQCTDRQLTPTD